MTGDGLSLHVRQNGQMFNSYHDLQAVPCASLIQASVNYMWCRNNKNVP